MTRRFQAVPPSGSSLESVAKAVSALRTNVAYITAQSQPEIQPLASNATLAQVIAKLNEVVARLQGTE